MNLADITTKCYILALIIRDDGERLLLGDGAYEFKDSQQHFIANTYANDVVELQGTDGQMLAGQVRRTATQTFAGYIGDATFSKQKVEEARRDFLMFFRKKHYYTAVYVFSDGTAIQRDRGYIVNAPSAPELYQRFPEWSVGLNFEDPNYYEYAEDDLGHEIAAHKVELELSTAMSGGLIWDGDGAVSDDLSYVGTEIEGEGKNFQLADTGTATLKSAELLGDAEQTTYSGKNLVGLAHSPASTQILESVTISSQTDEKVVLVSSNTAYACLRLFYTLPAGTYTASTKATSSDSYEPRITIYKAGIAIAQGVTPNSSKSFTLTESATIDIRFFATTSSAVVRTVTFYDFQLEKSSSATAYEPYVGGTASPNPDYPQAVNTVTGENVVKITGKNLFNKATATQDYRLGSTGDPFADNDYYLSDYISVTPNVAYYISGTSGAPASSAICFYASDKSFISRRAFVNDWYTFTTPANTAFLRFTTLKTNSIDQVQLELGSTATTYEPYQGQTKTVNLGKNLLQPMTGLTNSGLTGTTNTDGTITVTGTASYNYSFFTDTTAQNIPAGTYTFSDGLIGQTYRCIARFTYSDNTYVECDLRNQGAGKSFTLTKTAVKCQIRLTNIVSGTTYNLVVKPQVEKGSTATTYAPFLVTKNLFNKNTATQGKTINLNTGTVDITTSDRNTSDFIPVEPNKTYILSSNGVQLQMTRLATYNGSKTFNTSATSQNTFTAGVNDRFIRFSFDNTKSNIMFELGSTATFYEPYGAPYELAKIGNYQDRIYKSAGKWYIEKQVGKVVLDGTETGWGADSASTPGLYRYNLAFSPIKIGYKMAICDYFTMSDTENFSTIDTVCFATHPSQNRLIFFTQESTGTAWKAWLASNPTTVYYALATPTTTEITNSELVGQLERLRHSHTYTDTTNFSITATSPNLPAFLKVVAFGKDATPQGGYVWEDGGAGGATTITVDGVDNAQPIWTVVGPATNPSLTNITTGESIQWTGVVPNGQTLVVNMADMTASLSGANVFEFISGSWITLQAGNNRVSYSATAATGIATLEWNGVVG